MELLTHHPLQPRRNLGFVDGLRRETTGAGRHGRRELGAETKEHLTLAWSEGEALQLARVRHDWT